MNSVQLSKEDIIRHIVIWVILILILCIGDPIIGTPLTQIIGMSIAIINYMISYYVISLFIFPRYNTKPFYLIISLIVTLFLYYTISYVKIYYILVALKSPSKITTRPIYQFLIDSFLLFSIVAYCSISFYFNKLRIHKLKIQNEREKALLLKELVYFRNQFSSHVTFNFLNYCYSHVHKNSPEAAKAIELYSDMLRYSSDNLSESKALLKKEIGYLNKYIGLRKLLNKKVFVNFKVQGGINGMEICPRLLLTFVENAFKHGIYNDPENPVEIVLNSRGDRVSFTVTNKARPNKNRAGTGTGLINARQLLQLHYPDRHNLELAEYAGQYRCTLELNLS